MLKSEGYRDKVLWFFDHKTLVKRSMPSHLRRLFKFPEVTNNVSLVRVLAEITDEVLSHPAIDQSWDYLFCHLAPEVLPDAGFLN